MTYKYPEKHDRNVVIQRDVDTLFGYFNDLNNGSNIAIVQDLYVSNALTSSGSWQNVDWSLFKTVATPSTMHSFTDDTITINEKKNYTVYFGVNYTSPAPCNIIAEVMNGSVSLLSQQVSLVTGDTGEYENWDKKTVKLSAGDSITVRVKNTAGSGNTVKIYMFIVCFDGIGNAKSKFAEKHYFNQPDIERAFTCLNDINKGRTIAKPFPEDIKDNDINELYQGIRDLVDNGSTTALKCNVECLDIGTVLSGSEHTPTWGNQTGSLVLTITGGVVYLTPTEPITMTISVHDPASHNMIISSGKMIITKYTLDGTPVTLPDIYELDVSFNLSGTSNDTFILSVNTFDTTYHLPCFRLSSSQINCQLKLLKYSTTGQLYVWQMHGKDGINSFCSDYSFKVSSGTTPEVEFTDFVGCSNMVMSNASGQDLMYYSQYDWVNAVNNTGDWEWYTYLNFIYPPPFGYLNFGTHQLFIFEDEIKFCRMFNTTNSLIYELISLNQEDGSIISQSRETIDLNNIVPGQTSAAEIFGDASTWGSDLTYFKVSDDNYFLYLRFYAKIQAYSSANGYRAGNIIFDKNGYSVEYSVGTYPVLLQPIYTNQLLKPSNYINMTDSITRIGYNMYIVLMPDYPEIIDTQYKEFTVYTSNNYVTDDYVSSLFTPPAGFPDAYLVSVEMVSSTIIINDTDILNIYTSPYWKVNRFNGVHYLSGDSNSIALEYTYTYDYVSRKYNGVRESFTGLSDGSNPFSSIGATDDKIFIISYKTTVVDSVTTGTTVVIKIYNYALNFITQYEMTDVYPTAYDNHYLGTIKKDGISYCYWTVKYYSGGVFTLNIGRASVENGLEVLWTASGLTSNPLIYSSILDSDGNLLLSIKDDDGDILPSLGYGVIGLDWDGNINCTKAIDVDELVAGQDGVWGIKKDTGYIYKL